jgi:ABC-type Fe3+/spermidine/putrescine transport system ATPase subunit
MQVEVRAIQQKLGITTISVTHDQEEAITMSDKICLIADSTIQQYDTPRNIYTRPINGYVADFMGSVNLFPCSIIEKKRKMNIYLFINLNLRYLIDVILLKPPLITRILKIVAMLVI